MIRSMLGFVAMGCLGLSGPSATPRAMSVEALEIPASVGPVVSIASLCTNTQRTIGADVTVMKNEAVIHSLCVDDRTGKSATSVLSKQLSFGDSRVELRSIYSPEMVNFKASVKLDVGESNRQLVEISSSGGSRCASVSAVGRGKLPVPQRFISASNDWRSSIDYLLDDSCKILAVRLGNELAVIPIEGQISFNLYSVHFVAVQRAEPKK